MTCFLFAELLIHSPFQLRGQVHEPTARGRAQLGADQKVSLLRGHRHTQGEKAPPAKVNPPTPSWRWRERWPFMTECHTPTGQSHTVSRRVGSPNQGIMNGESSREDHIDH